MNDEPYTHMNTCPLLHGPWTETGYHIPTDGINKTADPPERETATTLILIVEGAVSAELLKMELARILPVKRDWTVEESKEREFVVPFPNKMDLDRFVAIKRIPMDNN